MSIDLTPNVNLTPSDEDYVELPYTPAPFMVRIWADNSHAAVEDIREGEYNHMSDDYQDINVWDPSQLNTLEHSLQQDIIHDYMF